MSKAKYEKFTKAQLMDLCKKRDIPYKSKLKKAEIIDLIIHDKKKATILEGVTVHKDRPKKPPKAKAQVPKTKVPMKPKDSHNKQSVIMVVPLIQNIMANIEKSVIDNDKRSSIDSAEQLKMIIDQYDFHNMKKLKDDITRSINLVIENFSSPAPKIKRSVSYEITDVDVKFKSTLKPKSRKKLSITLEELQKEIENPEFISNFTKSIKDLMRNKVQRYTKIMNRVAKENEITDAKVKKLKASGTTDRVIEDMYPYFSMMKAFKLDLDDLIELIKRKASITENVVKTN
ncbi:MAG TPA: hypothetical protein PKD85_01930 [Saprospiraceae bacterium]|nr:hypothetical protein [Saprospiraceae bacterium]